MQILKTGHNSPDYIQCRYITAQSQSHTNHQLLPHLHCITPTRLNPKHCMHCGVRREKSARNPSYQIGVALPSVTFNKIWEFCRKLLVIHLHMYQWLFKHLCAKYCLHLFQLNVLDMKSNSLHNWSRCIVSGSNCKHFCGVFVNEEVVYNCYICTISQWTFKKNSKGISLLYSDTSFAVENEVIAENFDNLSQFQSLCW
jgi:hypothetical protein